MIIAIVYSKCTQCNSLQKISRIIVFNRYLYFHISGHYTSLQHLIISNVQRTAISQNIMFPHFLIQEHLTNLEKEFDF